MPQIAIFIGGYRWYGYHSQSWVEKNGIVLPTLQVDPKTIQKLSPQPAAPGARPTRWRQLEGGPKSGSCRSLGKS
jgi:hypothetical protein